jgi:hypothetical protein
MFEITGDDIAALSDTDLRTLIGLLCEAEMRRRTLPTSAVTWGGNQTAKDGGLDVRVNLPVPTDITGFIPGPQTGFQVKKPDMPRNAILEEMKPNGVLRQVILHLASGRLRSRRHRKRHRLDGGLRAQKPSKGNGGCDQGHRRGRQAHLGIL